MSTRAWVVLGVLVAAGLALIFTGPLALNFWRLPPAAPRPVTTLGERVSEAQFEAAVQADIKSDSPRASVWRGARSDHRLIVHAILACKGGLKDFVNMPASMFGALLLDLSPTGAHILPTASDASSTSAPPETALQPSESSLLALSDSIARARLLAVSEYSQALPDAKLLYWLVLGVSGLATFFVTLQSKLGATKDVPDLTPQPEDPEKLKGWQEAQATREALKWYTRRREIVAILAMALSIFGTTLTALKQYYDPVRALVQNEQALRQLRKLHQEIASGVVCSAPETRADAGQGPSSAVPTRSISAPTDRLADWSKRLAELQAEIFPPYAGGGSTGQGATAR